jgi:hypothetical protein
MGWLRAVTQKKKPQATELSQLKEELRRVSQTTPMGGKPCVEELLRLVWEFCF